MIAGIEGLALSIEVVGCLRTFHDLKCDHLVQVLRRNLCYHLGDRWLEHSVVAIAVVCRDLAERLEANCFICWPGSLCVGDTKQVHWLDVVVVAFVPFFPSAFWVGPLSYG